MFTGVSYAPDGIPIEYVKSPTIHIGWVSDAWKYWPTLYRMVRDGNTVDTTPPDTVLIEQAREAAGGPDAMLIAWRLGLRTSAGTAAIHSAARRHHLRKSHAQQARGLAA